MAYHGRDSWCIFCCLVNARSRQLTLKNKNKRDVEIQINHEHNEKHVVENQSHMGLLQLERKFWIG